MTTSTGQKIALVTGANRGLGLEACRQLVAIGHRVILGSRDAEAGRRAAHDIDPSGTQVVAHALDVASETSVQTLRSFVEQQYGRLDILINNAGISLDVVGGYDPADGMDGIRQGHTIFDIPKIKLLQTLETNTIGAILTCQAFIPLMQRHHYGRVVNVSSQMGQLAAMDTDWPAYRISKTALNAATRIFAKALEGEDILINAVHPGWVRTAMGGPQAPKSVAEGVATILWAATLPTGGPTGQFLKDRHVIAW